MDSPALRDDAVSANRLTFETLIADTSARLMRASPSEIPLAIEAALDEVRLFFEAGRCGLMEVDERARRVNVFASSYAEGVSRVPRDLNVAPLFPWCTRQVLDRHVPVVIPRMADLPPEAADDRAQFARQATLSNLMVPIMTGSVLTHVMVVASVTAECQWPDHLTARLRVLGEMMAGAIQRKEAFEAILKSEERLTRAAAAAGCGLWELDQASGEIWVTTETRRLFGLSLDASMTYDGFVALLHPEDREPVVAKLDAAVRGGIFETDYRIVLQDGSVRWIHAVGRGDGAGRVLGASLDVTERVQTDRQLREQIARVSAAVDTAEVGFADSALHGDDVLMDARLTALLGIEAGDDRMPDLWLSRIDATQRDDVRDHGRRLAEAQVERATAEYRYEHPTRGWIWLRHSTRRVEHSAGTARLISAVQDITERRVREEALQTALEELKRLRDRLEHENVYLRKEVTRAAATELVAGRSAAVNAALAMAEQVAATTSTVLLVGETGTGKERFAEYIHRASPRRGHHMVRVNCSAIPSALIESELFGRERGAYTGALSKQIGRFELAQGSTLFLDEIGDLPMDVQVKLLRVLQERTIERLGSPTPIAVDVRIIAATNRDLEAAVRNGTFRADLYYRLNVFPIVIPPLRERKEDIPGLVDVLVSELSGIMRKRFDAVDAASLEALARYDWPGNVRELRNVLERAMILAKGPVLTVAAPQVTTVAPQAAPVLPAPAAGRELRDIEREHIVRVLEQTGWRIRGKNAAAEVLGLKPTTLEARMERLGIRRAAVQRPQ